MSLNFIRVTGELNGIKVDPKWTKALDEKLQRLIWQAAREWLRAIVKTIPVWKGFAQGAVRFAEGTHGDLAAYLRVLGELPPIFPKSDRPRYYYPPGKSKVEKLPENAGRFSNYSFSFSQHRYRFSFRNDILYFIINDFYGSKISPQPWHSTETAFNAFNKYIRENIKNLPQIKDALIKDPAANTRLG